MTTTQSLRAQTCPDSVCLKTSSRTFSASQWENLTKRAAAWLLNQGEIGSTVAVNGQNRWETLLLFWAAVRTGFVFMPLDPRMTEAERNERLQLANPALYMNEDDLNELEHQLNQTNPSSYSHPAQNALFYSGFTSGSSGKPKQFARNQSSWLKSFEAGLADFPFSGTETAVIAGPIHHSLFLYGAAFALYTGQPILLTEKFLPDRLSVLLNQTEPFVFYAVPTMLEAMQAVNGKGIVFLSGAGWSAERKKQWSSAHDQIRLFEFYGASELSFVSYMTPEDVQIRPSSSGKPSTGVTVEIRSGGAACAPFEIGTVYVNSPMLFSGYMEEGRCRLDLAEDGFYTVGDAGYVDEDGYLYIVGREQFMMISGGVNIYPEEVERVVIQCPDVEAAAVTSIPDDRLGERLVCLYTGIADQKTVRRFVKARLSVEKTPRRFVQTDALPLTSNGKVARAELKKIAEEWSQ